MLPIENNIETSFNHINIGPPSVDYSSFLETLFHKGVASYPVLFSYAQDVVGILIAISIPLSLFFIIVIIYCVERLKKIRDKEEQIYDVKVEPAYQEVAQDTTGLSNRWERISMHINSNNQNDWKQAILEADIILDEILTSMGYRGESVGEKLKRVNPGDFASLNEAWEAHKVRNQIAHEPGFLLGHHESKQAIAAYRKVFEEFYYV
jgi:uncharacterized protein YukE